MSELIGSIRKHLGIRVAEDQLDHYSLLGINRDASASEIKQALRSVVASWNASDTKSEPEAARVVAKLIKQAQAVLLDASSKNQYDEQLSRQASSASYLLFPQADPFAPFDPNACTVVAGMNSSIHSFGNANDRWNELRKQIPMLGETLSIQEAPLLPVARREETASAERGESLVSKIERLKRKRKLKQGLYVAGFLAVAAAFLGYASFQFIWNRLQITGGFETAATLGIPAATLTNSKSPSAKTIGGQNATKKDGTDPAFVFPTLAKNNELSDPVLELPIPDATPLMPIKPTNVKPMVAAASGTSKTAWIEAMTKGKESVQKADFIAFHKQMELALPLSTTDEMQSKHARLDQLGQLYEIFIKGVREAKSKMRGAEALSVGKFLVGIVEIKEEEIIVRMEGKKERFAWDRLPPGIAMAMADLTLSEQEPTDIAARAVYFSLSPARNELFEKKVIEWFEKSVGKGTIRKDLVQALSDTYE